MPLNEFSDVVWVYWYPEVVGDAYVGWTQWYPTLEECCILDTRDVVRQNLAVEIRTATLYCYLIRSAISANVAGLAVIYASVAFGDLVRSHFASRALYSIIDSCQEVKKGEAPVIVGSVDVRNVNFSYPSRPDVKMVQNLSLIVRNEQAVALVGASEGKSTVIQLLERFYDPDSDNI
ncbi:hypothetical protein ANCDUO_21402, partial [Ancylostoma duodenale]